MTNHTDRTEYEFPRERALADGTTEYTEVTVAELIVLRDSLAAQIDHAHAPHLVGKTTCKSTGQLLLDRVDAVLAEAGYPQTDVLRGRYNVDASHRGLKRDWSPESRGELR